ncbi:MAG: phospholipase A [Burkholderiales bacterium]
MLRGLALACAAASLAAAAAEPPAPTLPDGSGPVTLDQPRGDIASPISANEPVYFAVGTRDHANARFQLSFKYRLFDRQFGWGRDQPWLAGLHFAYTQTSIWDLEENSKPFRDTSYRPSLFWEWQGPEKATWLDGLRLGFEHESNGRDGAESRSINIVFVRPEWHRDFDNGKRLEFTPKFYYYLDKQDNPDIQEYRGYVDWRLRYGNDVRSWFAIARYGTAGKGSLELDWFQRTRVLSVGGVSGYFQVQFFTGYGEDILDYNHRYESQLRLGLAIVP